MNGDAAGRSAGGRSDLAPKFIVALVCDSDPIDRAQDNRFLGAKKDNPARAEAEIPRICNTVVGHPAIHRRRRIDIEGGQPQGFFCLRDMKTHSDQNRGKVSKDHETDSMTTQRLMQTEVKRGGLQLEIEIDHWHGITRQIGR